MMRYKQKGFFKWIVVAWFGGVLINLTIVGLLIWAAIHFIKKFW